MAFATHFAIGTSALFLAMQGAWSLFGPTPPPIIINEISYRDGMIMQDRVVTTSGPFTAFWEAAILDGKTGLMVPGCQGSGVWDYPPGHKAPAFPVSEWVGNPNCDLPPGLYIPTATYSAGEFRIVARGNPFEVTE